MHKIMSAALACAMATSMCVPVMAAETAPVALDSINANHNRTDNPRHQMPMTLNVLDTQIGGLKRFSVTAPTSLPVVMDISGETIVATNAKVHNHSNKGVQVRAVELTAGEGWTLKNYGDDITSEAAGAKSVGVQINKCQSSTEGLTFSQDQFPVIDVDSEMPINYTAKLPRQTAVGDNGAVANVVFVIGWEDGSAISSMLDKTKLASVAAPLTGTITFSSNRYEGPTELDNIHDVSVAGDGSVICAVVGQNATIYGDCGVLLPEDSSSIFGNYAASTIDVSGLNRAGVNTFSSMVGDGYYIGTTHAKFVGTEKMDVSTVTNYTSMFYGMDQTKNPELNLSTWDLTKPGITLTSMLPAGYKGKVICRTQADVDALKAANPGVYDSYTFEVANPDPVPETPETPEVGPSDPV